MQCRRPVLLVLVAFAYLASVVPVGIGLYWLKSELGINIIRHGGWHDFRACVDQTLDPLK